MPLHLLFKAFEDEESDDNEALVQNSDGNVCENDKNHNDDLNTIQSQDTTGSQTNSTQDDQSGTPLSSPSPADKWTIIKCPATQAAQSIVKTCLHHVCK